MAIDHFPFPFRKSIQDLGEQITLDDGFFYSLVFLVVYVYRLWYIGWPVFHMLCNRGSFIEEDLVRVLGTMVG